MSPRMQSNPLILERRTAVASAADCQPQAKGGGTTRKSRAFSTRDQILSARRSVVFAPAANGLLRLWPDGDFAVLPAFPVQSNNATMDVFGAHLQHFRDASPSIEQQRKKQV